MTGPRKELGPCGNSEILPLVLSRGPNDRSRESSPESAQNLGRDAKIGVTTPLSSSRETKAVSMSFAATRSANSNVAQSKRRKVLDDLRFHKDLKWDFLNGRSSMASFLILRVILGAGVEYMVGRINDAMVKVPYKDPRGKMMMMSVVKLPYCELLRGTSTMRPEMKMKMEPSNRRCKSAVSCREFSVPPSLTNARMSAQPRGLCWGCVMTMYLQ